MVDDLSIPAWFDWRPAHLPGAQSGVVVFQSQLGSIGAIMPPGVVAAPSGLSIPAWFDWRTLADIRNLLIAILSIPAWFDWRAESLQALQ